MAYQLKPFVINLGDLAYLLKQINFKPMFDLQGNAVVDWDGLSSVYDAKGALYDLTGLSQSEAWAAYGHGFPSVTAPIGIRDVSGFHNNLFGTQAQWGMVDVPFERIVPADYSNYTTSPGADYTPGAGTGASLSDVLDYMPRIISRTITTAGVNLLKDGSNHYVEWRAAKYADPSLEGLAYKALVDSSGVNIAQLVEGAKIVAPVTTEIAILDNNGDPLVYTAAQYQQSVVYSISLAVFAASSVGGLKDSLGGTLEEGEAIYYRPFAGSPLVNTGQTYQPDALVYKQLIDANVDFSAVAPADNTAIVTTLTESGYGLLETLGHIDFQNPTSGEFFIGSENPGVSPVNSWFAIFGQFFDHGLDKLGAGGNGKITIALDPSDPLYGVIGSNGQPITSITVTRATIAGTDANGDAAYINHTSPFIDQSQTYGSHEQLTNLLRKWVDPDGNSTYQAGMELLDGTTLVDAWERRWPDGSTEMVNDTLPTLAELNAHLIATGRDPLNWFDVLNLRNRDANGDVIPDGEVGAGNSGSPLLLDMNPHFDTAHMSAATEAALALEGIIPDGNGNYALGGPGSLSTIINFATFEPMNSNGSDPLNALAQQVLFDSVSDHYIAGDGRVNENFGLTAIHHVFHEEHNYQVENLKTWIYAHDANKTPADHAGLHDWQINTGTQDANGNYIYANGSIAWDSDKMFEGTKLIVEMEYQHAAIDQYARTITPRIQEFVGYSSSVDPTISLEYAQVAFRFGHSTIRETIDTIDPSGWFKGAVTTYALEAAFLAPQTFAQEGAAAITLGLSRQQMNEVDEFITPALNQGLLGQPLDLATINLARARDMGIPTLNDFRAAIGLTQYTSWADFGANMIHPESLVNFIAAFSFGGDVAKAAEIMALADGTSIDNTLSGLTVAEAIAFMNNGTGAPLGADGFNHIDSWIGGLAEAHVPGGLLGETFDAVFVAQMQALMDGDRFYYLYRLFGTQIGEEVNNGQFKDIVERNTGLSHLNGSIFAYADKYYDFTDAAVGTGDAYKDEHSYAAQLLANPGVGMYSDGGASTANNGTIVTVDGVTYINDIRPELDPTQVHTVEGTPTSGADSHEVIVGTDNRDYIHARGGDDTIYGEGGNDTLFGDGGIDRIYGGDGNDVIDAGEGPDLVDGGAGDDTIYGRGSGSEVGGFDQLVGGGGNDLIIGGEGIDKLSGGAGDDVIFGDGIVFSEMGNTDPFTHGGDGNDYIDGGASGDLLYGDEGDDLVVGSQDQDIVQGNVGDDILRPGNPSQAINGGPDEVVGDDGYTNNGYDLIDFSDYTAGAAVTADLINQANPLVAIDGTSPMPAMFQVEGIIGTQNNDTITGDSAVDGTATFSQGNNWLIGGSGNDTLQGKGGNDVIIGDGIRLDSLIGRYETAPGVADTYATYDAYADASHRVAAGSTLSEGLLGNAALGTAGFDKHYTEMLSSAIFQGLELGGSTISTLNGVAGTRQGDGGTAGSDTVVFRGNSGDYTVEEILFNTANEGTITAYKIIDNVLDRLDANGAVIYDGTDIVVGAENFRFANGDFAVAQLLGNAPEITSNGGGASAAITIDENTTFVTDVDATDADSATLTYTISGGADAALFAMEANGVLSFITAPDFEAPASFAGNNIYDVIVQVSDGVKVDTQTLAVTINNVDEAATGALQITSYEYDETTASLTATNTLVDPDGMTGFVQFQWQQLVAGNWVNIAGATGESSSNRSNATIRVQSTYTDIGGLKTITSQETAIIGTSGNNTRVGTAGNEYLLGLAGNDTLTGGAGNDTVDGGVGNDRLFATVGDGNDIYVGGTGVDTYDLSNTAATADVNLTAGTAASAETGNDTLSGIENVVGSNGNNTITDGIGSNQLDGRAGNDAFVMTVDNARDNINGGTGNDTIDYSAFAANLSVTLDTNNQVNVTRSGFSNANRDQIRNVENFIGGSGNDSIAGDSLANQLAGGGGNDTLSGFNGADTLNGSAGLDTLTGGSGADVLTGGADADTFDFNATGESGIGAAARDLITDFLSGIDKLDFSTIDARTGFGVNAGNQAFTFNGTEGAAITGAGQLVYHYEGAGVNEITVIQGNVNNNLGVDFEVALTGHITFNQATDLVL